MSSRVILSAAILACLAAAMMWQRSVLGGLRAKNQELQAMKAEADRLAAENQDLAALRAVNKQSVDGAGSELLRLRGEVRQLRAQQPQIDRLRVENEGLAAAIRGGVAQPQKFSEMEGFMAKDSWSKVGFATPDATLQTFFWAIREGDVASLAECMSPRSAQHLRRLNEPGNEQERDRTLEGFRELISGAGLRVADQQSTAADKTTAGIQAAAGGAIIKLQLRRYGTEWKLEDF